VERRDERQRGRIEDIRRPGSEEVLADNRDRGEGGEDEIQEVLTSYLRGAFGCILMVDA
jgi:hypothetical protein